MVNAELAPTENRGCGVQRTQSGPGPTMIGLAAERPERADLARETTMNKPTSNAMTVIMTSAEAAMQRVYWVGMVRMTARL